MEAIYLFLIIVFVPLLVLFNIITFLAVYCNPDIPVRTADDFNTQQQETLLSNIINGKCTWVYDHPEPLIKR